MRPSPTTNNLSLFFSFFLSVFFFPFFLSFSPFPVDLLTVTSLPYPRLLLAYTLGDISTVVISLTPLLRTVSRKFTLELRTTEHGMLYLILLSYLLGRHSVTKCNSRGKNKVASLSLAGWSVVQLCLGYCSWRVSNARRWIWSHAQ